MSQMREELQERDTELMALKPGHRASLWGLPRTARTQTHDTWFACQSGCPPRGADTEAAIVFHDQAMRSKTQVGAAAAAI